MNSLRILRPFFLMLVLLTIHFVAEARGDETITISPSATNSYIIPPERTSNTINFDIHITNIRENIWYGYYRSVDGSDWSIVDLGNLRLYGTTATRVLTVSFGEGSHIAVVKLAAYTGGEWTELTLSASSIVTLTQYHRITVLSSYGGGSLYIDGESKSSGGYTNVSKYTTHTIRASNREYVNGYWRQYRQWSDNLGQTRASGSSVSFSAYVDGNVTFTASFAKEIYVYLVSQDPNATMNFDNYSTIGTGGFSAYDDDQSHTITAVTTSDDYMGLRYTFLNWSVGSTVISTSASTQVYPTDHITYTAVYDKKPLPPSNVQAGGSIGQHVTVTWTDNPNPDVEQYQIWRNRKNQSSEFVAMVGRYVGSWTDPTYIITGTNDVMLFYAVYTVWNSILSDPANAVTSGSQTGPEPRAIGLGPGSLGMNAGQSPQEYAVASFPNPFNPSTTISYQLVEAAVVTLEIFDIVGRKLAVLINDQKSGGYHTVKWDGGDSNGKPMSSGIYLYRFLAVPASGKEPFRSSGKLMMTK